MNGNARQLQELLDRELEAARQLSMALVAEREALTGDASNAVHAAAAEKVRLLAVIEKLEGERRSLCASPASLAAGFGTSVAERWRALMDLMAGCRAANEVNGHIIHIRQNQVQQLIDIVRGGPALTYGPQGKTFATALRALARA